MVTHRPIEGDEPLPVMALVSRVEYVGGPRDGQAEDRAEMPDGIVAVGGAYQRSVRCAEDGAMRYVWREAMSSERRS
jgi:hypothetical protein